MKNKKFNFGIAIFSIIFLSLIAIFISYFQSNKNNKNNKIKKLQKIEIKEYEGEKLSSITDFRENSIKGPQYINREKYRLKIVGLSEEDKSFSYDEIINDYQNYKKIVTLNCVEGWSVNILWEGILLKDLIKKDWIPDESKTIIFKAEDGYTTSFPVDYIFKKDILMAHKMNELKLPPERGFPFQLVAEDKYGYKWIKWITEIEFSNDINYEGYWESRGYSNSGNLDKDFLK